MMSPSRVIPLYDPAHQPSNWNERMTAGEYAVMFSYEHPYEVNGVPTPDGNFCVAVEGLAEAEQYARQAIVEQPKMLCKIYDNRGLVGAPLREVAGAQVKSGEISRKFRLWAGGILFGAGIILGGMETWSGFSMDWPGALGSRIGPAGALLLLTEAGIALSARHKRRQQEAK